MDELRKDPLVKDSGARLVLGMPSEEPFLKSQVEVSYMEPDCAKNSFCIPEEGRLPREGTMEAAALRRTRKSCAKEVLAGYERQGQEDISGQWDMSVVLKNSLHIEANLEEILENHGYQNNQGGKEDYIDTGVNWGYTGAQMGQNMSVGTIAGMAATLLLIVFSGYLIIYNIFRISVVGDIRFYGLLKTIGTTGRQIRRIIRRQALFLSGIGIPIGFLAGWFVGAKLTPIVMENLSYHRTSMSMNPLIFVAAGIFSFATVLLSCQKPAKIAGKVSPVEAMNYTEGKAGRKKAKKSEHGGRVHRMVSANLSRSKGKTALVVASLSLAILLLNMTYTFANGFDMEKYLENRVCTRGRIQPLSSWG